MKKLALATLLALSTSAAFAGFNGNTAQGGFQGSNQGQQLTVCLLYTSPSPRDRSVSRMPSSA